MRTEKPLGELFGTKKEETKESWKYKELKEKIVAKRRYLDQLYAVLKDNADSLPLIPSLKNKEFWELQLAAGSGDKKMLEKLSQMRLSLDKLETEIPEAMETLMEKIKEAEHELKELSETLEIEWWNIPRGKGEA